jgi:hypothetical protein
MIEQPRDDKGRFTRVAHQNAEFNEDVTIGKYPAEDVTPSAEFVNVDLELLEQAIEDAKEFDGMIRIATMSKEYQDDGKLKEHGVVCVKGAPSDDEVVAVSGLERTYDGDSDE